MKVFVFLFTGFHQGTAQPTGLEYLYAKLDHLRRPGVSIEYKPWWTDVEALASFVNRQIVGRTGASHYRIVVVGYSYGGDRAVRLCRALRAIGIQVQNLYLIDAVWRPRYPLPFTKHLPSLLSIFSFPKIVVPDNVKHVRAWRQKYPVFAEWPANPRGHQIVVEDRNKTTTHGVTTLNKLHSQMDDCPSIHEIVLLETESLISQIRKYF